MYQFFSTYLHINHFYIFLYLIGIIQMLKPIHIQIDKFTTYRFQFYF